MLNIILGWKTPNQNQEVPEVVYCGNDGSAALKAASAADKTGKYAKGKIGRALVSHVIPFSLASSGSVPKAIIDARKKSAPTAPANPTVTK